jgi:endonuclease/exonuclease/phosphatase family metal-dependent hydrolase
MTTRSRVVLVALCALLLSALTSMAAPPPRFRAINLDLTQKAFNAQQMRAVLFYLRPDVLAIHNVRPPADAQGGNGSIASIAGSLNMYSAYEPAYPGADFGSALLSRYRIKKPTPISTSPTKHLQGMKADIVMRTGGTLTVVLVRPTSAQEAKDAVDVVSQLVRGGKKQHLILMASFDTGAAMDTIKAWGRAGLQDAAVALRTVQPTFPADKPAERLDYFLVSPSMRPHLRAIKRIRSAVLRSGSEHVPIELTFTH